MFVFLTEVEGRKENTVVGKKEIHNYNEYKRVKCIF